MRVFRKKILNFFHFYVFGQKVYLQFIHTVNSFFIRFLFIEFMVGLVVVALGFLPQNSRRWRGSANGTPSFYERMFKSRKPG